MRVALRLAALAAALAGASALAAEAPVNVLDLTLKRIDGTPQPLAEYAGKVLLFVNVASKCGLTPQYEGLEALQRRYAERGFAVLGFPANDFAGQEPGTNAEIARFCRGTYGVSFPMFEKIGVAGDGMHPLYRRITGAPAPVGGPVEWNFQKYLVTRRGDVVARFAPRTPPDDPALVARIEALLTEPVPR